MSKNLLWKVIFVTGVIFLACYKLYPNIVWYSMPLHERQEQAKRKNPLAQKVIPLGLDLQGGVHLVYQVDTSKLPDVSDETLLQAIDQNMVVINNRIDALGVSNPVIARQGREFLLVQLPGVYASEDAKKIIGKTALLEFRIVRDNDALLKLTEEIQKRNLHPEDIIGSKLPEDLKKLVPEGLEILPVREGGYLLVNVTPDLTGKYLKAARVNVGGDSMQMGGLSIDFELDSQGATLFEALTSSHINDRLAIVLDGLIQSAPRIESRIPGGRGQITGSFSPEEAKLLANILNSGNLQAPMNVVEERTVGPELGEDSIRSGVRAMLLGFGLVVGFMFIYYKLSGLVADAALLLNVLLTFAAMALIKANMTLPGMAGLILSLAMSVDANIIILERVREELRKGKQAKIAIEEGYEKGSSAILDGNITAIMAAAFMFQFGPGPVKGFGITLMLGLGISMFTCVYVSKMIYDVWFSMTHSQKISV